MLLNCTYNISSFDIWSYNQFHYSTTFCEFSWGKYLQLFYIFLVWLAFMIIYFYNQKKLKKMTKNKGIKPRLKSKTRRITHIWKRFKKR